MNLTIKTHRSVPDADGCRRLLRLALNRHLLARTVPAAVSRRLSERVPLYLSPLFDADLAAYRRKVGLHHPERFDADLHGDLAADSALVAALIEHEIVAPADAPEKARSFTESAPAESDERAVLQRRLLTGLNDGLDGGKIALLEGSTGLGKSRVIGLAALRLLAAGAAEPVGICAPTIAGLAHLANEVRLAAETLGMAVPPAAVLLGRGQFISVEKVRTLAADLLAVLPGQPFLPGQAAPDVEAGHAAAHAALDWIDAGGAPTTEASRSLAEIGPGLCLLAEDLAAAVPAWADWYEPADYRLDAPEAPDPAEIEGLTPEQIFQLLDPAERVYQKMHGRACGGGLLVLMTQAKLCSFARQTVYKRVGNLPAWRALLVDEAHDLERQMSSACSRELSLLWLRSELRHLSKKENVSAVLKTQAKACIAALSDVIDVLRGDAVRARLDRGGLGAPRIPSRDFLAVDPRLKGALTLLHGGLRLLCKKRAKTAVKRRSAAAKRAVYPSGLTREQYYRLSTWFEGVEDVLKEVGNVTVTYSPVRRFPSLLVGPRNLLPFLSAVWASTDAAGLLSATLFHLDKDGRVSCGYLQRKLAIPEKRVKEVPPCHASWVWSTPTLYLPRLAVAEKLMYPKGQDRAEEAEKAEAAEAGGMPPDPEATATPELKTWWRRIAGCLSRIGEGAAGGTLVLCCSYRDVEALARRLEGTPGFDASRVVCHARGVSLARLRGRFAAKSREGLRPVWLATGAAWTGLDLRNERAEDPADDRLLTDLVITRLPFGQNRSAEHQARMQVYGFDAEAAETEMMLRQGLGRAIRRPGLQDRRIWMMDGRVVGPRAAYYKRMIGVLLLYPKQRGF